MTISALKSVLDEKYGNYRIVQNTKTYSVDIYVDGYFSVWFATDLDMVRPVGVEFRIKTMTFWQKLFFKRKSVA